MKAARGERGGRWKWVKVRWNQFWGSAAVNGAGVKLQGSLRLQRGRGAWPWSLTLPIWLFALFRPFFSHFSPIFLPFSSQFDPNLSIIFLACSIKGFCSKRGSHCAMCIWLNLSDSRRAHFQWKLCFFQHSCPTSCLCLFNTWVVWVFSPKFCLCLRVSVYQKPG